MVLAEEIRPGVFIGNCMVEPINNYCTVSVINTTEETVEIGTLYVQINELDTAVEICAAQLSLPTQQREIPIVPREEHVKRLL